MKFTKSILAMMCLLLALLVTAAVSTVTKSPVYAAVVGFVAFALFGVLLPRPTPGAVYANNFGVLNNTTLIFDAFNQFLENLLPVRNMVLDVQDERTGAITAKPGDSITVKDWRSDVTVYQPGTAPSVKGYDVVSNLDTSGKDRQVILPNAPYAVSIALTPEEYRVLASGATGGANYNTLRTKLANLMKDGLGKQAISDWFAVITAANFPGYSQSAVGTFSRSFEVDLDTALFGRNVPSDGANMILNPTAFGEWTKDHLIIENYTGQPQTQGLLMDGGQRSRVSNFTFWRTNRPLPADANRGMGITRTAVVGAFRIPDEETYENDPVSLNQIIATGTQIPLLARLWKNAQTGAMQLDLAGIWKFAPGQSEAIQRIGTAAP